MSNMYTLVTHDIPTIHPDGSIRNLFGEILPSFLSPLTR